MTGEPAWRWPEKPANLETVRELVQTIGSPYETTPPPFCYPGTPLRRELADLAGPLLVRHLNAIGTHTHGEAQGDSWSFAEGEGGFEQIQRMEAEAVWMVASVMGGVPATVDGFFCGGGTEANLQGMWIGREYLQSKIADPFEVGTAILVAPTAHYSVYKGAQLLDIARAHWEKCPRCGRKHCFESKPRHGQIFHVRLRADGAMDPEHLMETIRSLEGGGYRRFLVVATVGVCLTGAVDPVEEIAHLLRERDNCYLHVDASFGGFTVPFMAPEIRFGFDLPAVRSIAVDADKMGGVPYPAGIFLCRKGLQGLVTQDVAYVNGHADDTLPGSRSAVSPVLAWYLMRSLGVSGQRAFVKKCIGARDLLRGLLMDRFDGDERIRFWPYHKATPFLPLEVNIEDGAIPEYLRQGDGPLAPYHLRSDHIERLDGSGRDPNACPATVYKLCLMPHTIPHLERFVWDLKRAMS
ncbi:aspartate aminotransferase family protein [Candidatus Uhrbacteria bacterium]|nr:aspartate aminotransferase family protein [Candidatus Uhrbacteria bacterium]